VTNDWKDHMWWIMAEAAQMPMLWITTYVVVEGQHWSNSVDSTRMESAKLPRRAVSDSWGAYRFDCLVPHIIIQMYIDI
jgi:hypothetical protein